MEGVLDCSVALAWVLPDETSVRAESESKRVVEIYSTLPIKTDADLSLDVVRRIQAVAQEYSLSAYDAAYLELAQRRGVGVATLDRQLAVASRKAGVKILSA